jgi:hypothetical protein
MNLEVKLKILKQGKNCLAKSDKKLSVIETICIRVVF